MNIIRSFVIFNFLKIVINLLNLHGVFWNPQELLLMMGTEILKIDAEMAEKIEVEVCNPHLKSDRKTEK